MYPKEGDVITVEGRGTFKAVAMIGGGTSTVSREVCYGCVAEHDNTQLCGDLPDCVYNDVIYIRVEHV